MRESKRNKVIRGLMCCIMEPETKDDCAAIGCPYADVKDHCMTEMHIEAFQEFIAKAKKGEDQ